MKAQQPGEEAKIAVKEEKEEVNNMPAALIIAASVVMLLMGGVTLGYWFKNQNLKSVRNESVYRERIPHVRLAEQDNEAQPTERVLVGDKENNAYEQ